MSSAIEVLKSEKVLYIEKIKEIESRFNGMPFDIKESYQKSVKVYQEFIDALGEALFALEKQEEWLSDIQMLKAENKELQAKLNACESRCINLEGELNEL